MMNQRIYAASEGELAATAPDELFIQMIARCAIMLGLPTPSAHAAMLMQSTIADHFIWATVDDIEMAVKLNLTRSLDTFTQPYGEMSTAYISDVLRAYQPHRAKARAEYRRMDEMKTVKELAPRVLTDEDWLALVEVDRAHINAGRDVWKIYAARMVKWLADTGRVTDDFVSDVKWREINARARASVMNKKNLSLGMIMRMPHHERARFDEECLAEKHMIVYGIYLTNTKQ
jgi:hypothetical protein